MRASTRREFVAGPAGRIECAVDSPQANARGRALIAHPHPQFGGTLDNKVVQTLARAFVELGYESWRPNFRGVGGSEGKTPERLVLVGVAVANFEVPPVAAGTLVIHGERDDTVPLAAVLDWARPQDLPVVLVPDADHFFHRKLHVLRGIVQGSWK